MKHHLGMTSYIELRYCLACAVLVLRQVFQEKIDRPVSLSMIQIFLFLNIIWVKFTGNANTLRNVVYGLTKHHHYI